MTAAWLARRLWTDISEPSSGRGATFALFSWRSERRGIRIAPALQRAQSDGLIGLRVFRREGIAASSGRYVLVSMADGSDEPHLVDEMVRLAEGGADVVAASRYMAGGRQIGGPRFKALLSRIAGLSLHHVAGVRTHDATNNFKLYSRRFLDEVTIESRAGFELALELTVKATIGRRLVAEVPTTWRDRTSGTSNFNLR